MIKRITLQNYMSHAHTVIEPAAGLTVLIGPNNCGKSAVVSALETLCNNSSGDYMVRHDAKEARVIVETDDNHVLEWRRRGATVSYVIDGREIHRLKGGVPEDLHRLLKLPTVAAGEGGDPFDIHFGDQKTPIFLLDEPESRAAVFFASSSDAAILLEMQKRHRNKVRERRGDEKRLRAEIDKLDGEIQALEPIDKISLAVAQAELEYQTIRDVQNRSALLHRDISALEVQAARHRELERQQRALVALRPPPIFEDTGSLAKLSGDLANAASVQQMEQARCRAMRPLSAPPALADVERLESLCSALEREELTFRILHAKSGCLMPLQAPPSTPETSPLERLVENLVSASRAANAAHAQDHALAKLTPPPELAACAALSEVIEQLEKTQVAVAACKTALQTAEEEIEDDLLQSRRLRLEFVRKLLHDAAAANERGHYLDAMLTFGQAAALYPLELADVENPEAVRQRFIDALQRYQAIVEAALREAEEWRASNQQPQRASKRTSRIGFPV